MKDLNGCYCEANKDTYDALLRHPMLTTAMQCFSSGYYVINENSIRHVLEEHMMSSFVEKIYLVNGEFTGVDPSVSKFKQDLDKMNKKMEEERERFAKYGFEVGGNDIVLHFDNINTTDKSRYVFGVALDTPCYWNELGECFSAYNQKTMHEYNLTPLKKEWYEENGSLPCLIEYTYDGWKKRHVYITGRSLDTGCLYSKRENEYFSTNKSKVIISNKEMNFLPRVLFNHNSKTYKLVDSKDDLIRWFSSGYIPATNEEIEALKKQHRELK